jgi:predicted nucleotidyltransferase
VLNQDFKEFIQSLNDNRVRHLVVGGYAVALHGHPRYTKDIGIWIELSPGNAANMISALEAFGFASLGLKETDFLTPGQVIQLGQPPSRIDLLCTVSGVDFAACHESRVTVEIDGVPVDFIGLEDLRKNKAASGRYQDLADLENLE